MKLRSLAPLAGGLALASALVASDADACGGCFAPPTSPTVVTGHRMALSITSTQTVLWDQFQYSGDPAEFAWVLPVKPGARIEVSTDAWFETLDAATNVQVVQPPISCHQPFSFGGGCGTAYESDFAGAFAEGSSGAGGGPKVDVVHRGTVGPYETVTLSTEEPGALNAWLTQFGFAVDPSTQPTIDAYVKEGFDFIAIRLQPDKGVREMKPVRVVSPGASPALPLRMVAIGTAAEVAVTLFVIGEGRWAADNFPNVRVPLDLLSWDFKDSTSNYAALRKQTLEASEGKSAWLTTYSRQGALLSPINNQFTMFNVNYGQDPNGLSLDTIAEAYLSQGILNKETALESGPVDEDACRAVFSTFDVNQGTSSSVVANPCPAGAPLDDPACGAVAVGEIDARVFACGALDDLTAALNGAHPRDVWLTRLEAALPQAALQKDLALAPAKDQKDVENWLQARIAVNPESFCGSFAPPVVWSTPGGRSWGGSLAGMSLAGLALAGVLARRRLRRA